MLVIRNIHRLLNILIVAQLKYETLAFHLSQTNKSIPDRNMNNICCHADLTAAYFVTQLQKKPIFHPRRVLSSCWLKNLTVNVCNVKENKWKNTTGSAMTRLFYLVDSSAWQSYRKFLCSSMRRGRFRVDQTCFAPMLNWTLSSLKNIWSFFRRNNYLNNNNNNLKTWCS